jgi:hypothetical protein
MRPDPVPGGLWDSWRRSVGAIPIHRCRIRGPWCLLDCAAKSQSPPAGDGGRTSVDRADCGARVPQVCHLRSAKTADCSMCGLTGALQSSLPRTPKRVVCPAGAWVRGREHVRAEGHARSWGRKSCAVGSRANEFAATTTRSPPAWTRRHGGVRRPGHLRVRNQDDASEIWMRDSPAELPARMRFGVYIKISPGPSKAPFRDARASPNGA